MIEKNWNVKLSAHASTISYFDTVKFIKMWSRFVKTQVKHNSYFLCGVALGLWISLVAIPLDEEVPECSEEVVVAPVPDEYSPQREERPLGPAGQASGRSVQRPRYYSTELGMRGSLLSGVLTSEGALTGRVSALNKTMQRLQPALKFFITASEMSNEPGLANVVGFTDTREMLKPFHALKYLADNYLEEFDFFFLVSDGAFVNAKRLTELVSRLSVSQEVYMGTVAEDDSHYCSLDAGIIISNSVLRAVHNELDWCVRNSYSPHHHENLGRCVLHAAHLSCNQHHQGESYQSVRLDASCSLQPELCDAVTAHPAEPADMHRLHAYVSRIWLERGRAAAIKLRGEMWHLAPRHPPHARNATWPAGLRSDPGLAPPTPPSRFDHLRWTLFNETHAFMPDEHRAVAAMTAPTTHAVQLVLDTAIAWARQRWAWASRVELAEGAWQWDPPTALRYRLLLNLYGPDGTAMLRLVEVARALGSARLVPVRYVTESARVNIVLLLPLTTTALTDSQAFLERYTQLSQRDANTNLYIVTFPNQLNKTTASVLLAPIRDEVASLASPQKTVEIIEGGELEGGLSGEVALYSVAGKEAMKAIGERIGADGLVLIAVPHLEFNQDFLNRVRMNCVSGAQWFSPLPFSRHAAYARAPGKTNTGRFNVHSHIIAAFYKSDYIAASSAHPSPSASIPSILSSLPSLRTLRAPDPAALLPPRPAPCPPAALHCTRGLDLDVLDLGARHTLAQLLLETEHEKEMKGR